MMVARRPRDDREMFAGSTRGFSLIELMVVISLLALLEVVVLLPALRKAHERANTTPYRNNEGQAGTIFHACAGHNADVITSRYRHGPDARVDGEGNIEIPWFEAPARTYLDRRPAVHAAASNASDTTLQLRETLPNEPRAQCSHVITMVNNGWPAVPPLDDGRLGGLMPSTRMACFGAIRSASHLMLHGGAHKSDSYAINNLFHGDPVDGSTTPMVNFWGASFHANSPY